MPSNDETTSRYQMPRWLTGSILVVALGIAAFHFYALVISPLPSLVFRAWHIAGLALFAALIALGRREGRTWWLVPLLAFGAVGGAAYITQDLGGVMMRAGVMPRTTDIVFAVITLVSILEITRRSAGNAVFALAMVAIGYGLYGGYLPEMLGHRGYSFERLTTYLFTSNGVFNIPVGSSATYIYLFVLFGALLMASGAGGYLIQLAMAVSGRARGGPAKVAIVASGFFGMINGTSAGNVVATGSMTIPLMKRAGYEPKISAAVEAAASSGGQILPPVMGAAAFLMVDMTGIAYTNIIFAAAAPALLYFLSLFMMSHYEAINRGIGGVNSEDFSVDRKTVLSGLYFLVPPTVLIVSLLVLEVSIIRAGIYSIVAAIAVSWLRRATAIGPRRFATAAIGAAENTLPIAATCATAGIIMGVLNLTGLGLKLATIIVTLTSGSLLATLVVAMLVTVVLGMGLPTVAAYAITGAVVAPAMTQLGVEPMAAHLFVLYFAAMSAITPPVALASFAAAALARAPVAPVAANGLKMGFAGFIVPYLFIYRPELLLAGESINVALEITVAVIAVCALAAGLQLRTNQLWVRGSWILGAALLLAPGILTTLSGIAVILTGTVWEAYCRTQARRSAGVSTS